MSHGPRYGGRIFDSETHARWGVFLDALGIDWKYKPHGEAHRLTGDRSFTPTFHLAGGEAYLDIHEDDERAREEDTLAPQRRAARLATDTGRPVILIHGTVERYRPVAYYPKEIPDETVRAWLARMPDSLKALEWDGLPEEIAPPNPTFTPGRVAWARHGVGLDFWAGRLALVACRPEPETDVVEDPYYGNLVEVVTGERLVYAAYGLHDPNEPLYVAEDTRAFQPQVEYQAAITAAKTVQLINSPHPTTLN